MSGSTSSAEVSEFEKASTNVSQEERWLRRAHAFAQMALGYRETLPEGDAWPTDEPGLFSPDYMYGAAGAGHYFLRLWKPGKIQMPLM